MCFPGAREMGIGVEVFFILRRDNCQESSLFPLWEGKATEWYWPQAALVQF